MRQLVTAVLLSTLRPPTSYGGIVDSTADVIPPIEHHIDFDSQYWSERKKLVSFQVGPHGEIRERYHNHAIESDYEEYYEEDYFEEKEEAFENLPEHVKIDYLGDGYNHTNDRRLFGKLGRGYLESLCGRDEGKPCAQGDFEPLRCSNYGVECLQKTLEVDCSEFARRKLCKAGPLKEVDPTRVHDEDYVASLGSRYGVDLSDTHVFVNLNKAPCVDFSVFFGGRTNFPEGIVVPPGVCVTMQEFKNFETLTFGDYIDILGMLKFPDGTRVKLEFPMMYIQGKMEMRSTAVIDNEPEITFTLTEPYTAPDRYFIPYGENRDICPEVGCLIGKNGILVAGGQVDIQAIPKDCPAWTRILDVETNPIPEVPPDQMPQQPALPENTTVPCTDTVVFADFENGSGGVYGTIGTTESILTEPAGSPRGTYMSIKNRKAFWMGATVELLPEEKECLLNNEMYFFSVWIRLTRRGRRKSDCSLSRTNCPMLYLGKMSDDDKVRWYKLAEVHPSDEINDDEWFHFTAEIYFEDHMTDHEDVFTTLSILGPEEHVNMDIDDFRVYLPPKSVYPPVKDTCEDLIINGNASLVPGFTFPMVPWMKAENLQIKFEADNSPYFHLGPRHEEYSTITFDILPPCLNDTIRYKFSTRIWVHSEEPVRPRPILKVHHPRWKFERPYHRPFHFDTITICDETSESIGWITCEEIVEFEWIHPVSDRIQFLILTQGSTADVSYANMTFSHHRGSETGGLHLDERIVGCWGEGPEVFITTEEIIWDKDKNANIKEVREDGTIFLDVDFKYWETPSSVKEAGIYAPEIAIKRRNILFQALNDTDDPYFGGYFLVLKTPGRQIIEGIEIRNFGQQRNVAKYPINIYHGGRHPDTLISKNYIQDSNLRGVVITGTQLVNITENVMYNISGNGVCMEEGSETYNTIQYNLGARIIPIIIENNWWYQEQDDRGRFIMIKNPKNHFIGNVATGGYWSGFWTQLHRSTHGESRRLIPPMNPRKLPFLTFRDNVAHGNRKSGFQFHPTYYWPNSQQILRNTLSYRNMWFGIYFFGTEHVTLDGGHVADNKIGIDMNYVDKCEVKNFEVVGYSLLFKDWIDSTKKKHLCWEFEEALSPAIHGIRIHANLMDHFHNWGTNLINITFDRLHDANGCPGSKAIMMNPILKDEVFSNKIAMFNLSFTENITIAEKFSLCEGSEAGLLDVNIYDGGDLNPNGDGGGWIVSADANMTRLAEECVEMPGSCAYYCKGEYTCFTKVSTEVEFSDTDDLTLLVEDQDGYVRAIKGFKYFGISEETTSTNWSARRHFAATLPEGNYTGSFWRDGEMVWPGFAETDIVGNFLCKDEMNSFEMIVPDPDPGYCDTLINNGDMEKSELIEDSEWHDTGGGLEFRRPGRNSNQAIKNKVRSKLEHGVAHFFDDRCLHTDMRWLVEGYIMMSNNDDCDFLSVSRLGTPMCPRFSLRMQTGRGMTALTTDVFIGRTVPPYKPAEWNLVAGTFLVSNRTIKGNSTALFLDGPPPPHLVYVDDVKTTFMPIDCTDRTNYLLNGNIDGDLRYWKYTGPFKRHRTGIEMINNREKYGTKGYSMTTVNRDEEWHGLFQDLITDCMEVGKMLEVKVQFRVEEEWGEEFICDPFLNYVLPNACPRARIKWVTNIHHKYYHDISFPIGPYEGKGWMTSHGIFELTEQHLDPRNTAIEIFFGKNWPHKNVVVNKFVVQNAIPGTMGEPPKCLSIVINGDAEVGDARYWLLKGNGNYGTIKMVSPGRGGSKYAFHHTGMRTRTYHGMWQKLPMACLKLNKFRVVAYFRLFNPKGREVTCDPKKKSGKKRCPVFFFQGHTPDKELYYKKPSFNTDFTPWRVRTWNRYKTEFEMDSKFRSMHEVWFYVHNVLPGYTYWIDDIAIVRIS